MFSAVLTLHTNSGVYAGGIDPDKPLFVCSVNTALNITNSAGNLKGVVTYLVA
jgi:hypothetical protein